MCLERLPSTAVKKATSEVIGVHGPGQMIRSEISCERSAINPPLRGSKIIDPVKPKINVILMNWNGPIIQFLAILIVIAVAVKIDIVAIFNGLFMFGHLYGVIKGCHVVVLTGLYTHASVSLLDTMYLSAATGPAYHAFPE